MSDNRAQLIDELRGLVATLEATIAEGWMPPSLAGQARQMVNWATELAAAFEAGRDDDVRELQDKSKHFDPWLQDLGTFETLIRSGAVVPDDAAGTVTLRWERVPVEHRKAATSLATELVDAYRGRSVGGRQRKS